MLTVLKLHSCEDIISASMIVGALTMKTRKILKSYLFPKEASKRPLCARDSLLVVTCTVWVVLVLKFKLCSWFPGSRRRLNAGETLMNKWRTLRFQTTELLSICFNTRNLLSFAGSKDSEKIHLRTT